MKTTKTKKLKSLSDFLGVIDYEGGLHEAFISHGMKLDDYEIPDDIKFRLNEAVEDYEVAAQELQGILDEIEDLAEPLDD